MLLAERDFETAYIYWWLLEQVSKFEDSSGDEFRGKITLNFSYFKRKLYLNFQRTSRVLQKIAKTFDLEININSDETIEVFIPKWLELQENRGGKNKAKKEQKSSEKRQEVRSKNKDIDKDIDKDIEKENFELKILNLYETKYPLKKGKKKGVEKLSKEIKSELDFMNLEKSVNNYAEEIRLNDTEPRYIKHFSTFASDWSDWIDFVPQKRFKSEFDKTNKKSFENERTESEQVDEFQKLVDEVMGR